MKTKKFLSLVLALAMIFSLSVSVLAGEGESVSSNSTDSNEFKATATVKIPTIDVEVPQSATLFINPMGFQVTIASGEQADVGVTEGVTTNKIVSPVLPIVNNSPMKLAVGVIGSVTAAATNTALAISATPIAKDDTKNSVFIYATFGKPKYENEKYALNDTAYSSSATTATDTAPATIALTASAPKTPLVVGSVAGATAGTGSDTSVKPGRFAFKFQGDCNANAKNEWNDGDSVEVKLVFSFKPTT